MNLVIILIVIGAFGTLPKTIIKGTGGLGGWRTRGDHPNYSIIANGQNTKKSPGELRRLDVTLTPVKNQPLELM